MLDSVNEITDIKKELQSYRFYDYADDDSFVDALEYAVETVMREKMYPQLTNAYYDSLAALGGKAYLDITTVNLYWAEVNYSIAEFYLLRSRKDKSARIYLSENASKTGVSLSGQASSKDDVAAEYVKKAENYMVLGGYPVINSVVIRQSVHV